MTSIHLEMERTPPTLRRITLESPKIPDDRQSGADAISDPCTLYGTRRSVN